MITITMPEALAFHDGVAWTKIDSRWEIESCADGFATPVPRSEPVERWATEVCYPDAHGCGCVCENCGSSDRILGVWSQDEMDYFECVNCLAVDEGFTRLARKDDAKPTTLPNWL